MSYIANITQSASSYFEPFRFVLKELSPSSIRIPTLVALGTVLAAGATWKHRTAILNYAEDKRQLYAIKFLYIIGRYDIEATNAEGKTSLHYAAEKGLKDIAEFLLAQGADTTVRDSEGRTPLHRAAFSGHIGVVKVLLKNGADITMKDSEGRTPFHLAAVHGQIDMIKLLHENGAEVDARNRLEFTPLHVAAYNGHKNVTEFLLEKGADFNAETRFGDTPLFYAAGEGHIDVAEALLDKGAHLQAQDKDGFTSLHCAARGQKAMAEFLITRGAHLQAQTKDGFTPLHVAALLRKIDVTETLLERGADIEAKNNLEQTPLHVLGAAHVWDSKSSAEILSLILNNYRASLRQKEARLRRLNPASPVYSFHALSATVLREYINQRDYEGKTSLHGFVERTNPSGVEILLKEGASLIPDSEEKTPLDIALERNLEEILEKFKAQTKYLQFADTTSRKTPVEAAYASMKHPAMEFFIKIEGNVPGTLFDSDRKLCVQYAVKAGRRDLQDILRNPKAEIA